MPADLGRLCFAPTRYGEGVTGGAEAVQRELAVGLRARGWDVEVATTCAVDHYTWKNELPEGESEVDGILVRRFPVEAPLAERGDHEARILGGERLTFEQQHRWMNSGMRSPALYHFLLDNQERYRGMVFVPYPTWLAFAGSQIAARRSVLWTCLHDEPYAYLDLFQPVFTGVAGLLLQSQPEVDLLHRLTGTPAPHELVGCPVDVAESYDPDGFRRTFGIEGPFLYYGGRREGAKGWEDLLAMFEQACARLDVPFKLVTTGAPPVVAPKSIADRVIDLGFVSAQDRHNAFAAASAYVQPSRYEAFSMTIMEAWLAATPVIANGWCDVVKWHCERSGAGLLYHDALEFEQCLTFLANAPEAAAELAAPGRAYVLENYQRDLVIDRVDAALQKWLQEPSE